MHFLISSGIALHDKYLEEFIFYNKLLCQSNLTTLQEAMQCNALQVDFADQKLELKI